MVLKQALFQNWNIYADVLTKKASIEYIKNN